MTTEVKVNKKRAHSPEREDKAVASLAVSQSRTDNSGVSSTPDENKTEAKQIKRSRLSVAEQDLIEACEKGSILDVERLLDKEKVSADARDGKNLEHPTALMVAVMAAGRLEEDVDRSRALRPLWERYEKIIEMLLAHNANIDLQSELSGMTALMCAYENSNYRKTNIVKILLKNKPNLELRDRYGRTVFMLAVQKISRNEWELIDDVETLTAAGANPAAKDNAGKNALMYACKVSFPELIKCLLKHPDCRKGIDDCSFGLDSSEIAIYYGDRNFVVDQCNKPDKPYFMLIFDIDDANIAVRIIDGLRMYTCYMPWLVDDFNELHPNRMTGERLLFGRQEINQKNKHIWRSILANVSKRTHFEPHAQTALATQVLGHWYDGDDPDEDEENWVKGVGVLAEAGATIPWYRGKSLQLLARNRIISGTILLMEYDLYLKSQEFKKCLYETLAAIITIATPTRSLFEMIWGYYEMHMQKPKPLECCDKDEEDELELYNVVGPEEIEVIEEHDEALNQQNAGEAEGDQEGDEAAEEMAGEAGQAVFRRPERGAVNQLFEAVLSSQSEATTTDTNADSPNGTQLMGSEEHDGLEENKPTPTPISVAPPSSSSSIFGLLQMLGSPFANIYQFAPLGVLGLPLLPHSTTASSGADDDPKRSAPVSSLSTSSEAQTHPATPSVSLANPNQPLSLPTLRSLPQAGSFASSSTSSSAASSTTTRNNEGNVSGTGSAPPC